MMLLCKLLIHERISWNQLESAAWLFTSGVYKYTKNLKFSTRVGTIKSTEQAGVVHDNKNCYIPTVHFRYGILSTVGI